MRGSSFGTFANNEDGQSLVEFSLLLPVLLLLVLGTIEFGRMIGIYLVMESSVREGARLGVTGAGDVRIEERVREMTDFLDQERLVVAISPKEGDRFRGDPLIVSVEYDFDFAVPFLVDGGGDYLLQATMQMRIE